jgi:hypothetical protein
MLIPVLLALIIAAVAALVAALAWRHSSRSGRYPYEGTPAWVPSGQTVRLPGGSLENTYGQTNLEQSLTLTETITPNSRSRSVFWTAKGSPDAVIRAAEEFFDAASPGGWTIPSGGYRSLPPG